MEPITAVILRAHRWRDRQAHDSGAVTHVSEFQPRGGTFSVHAVDTPGSVPVAVSGTCDLARGRLEFQRFRVQTQRARSQTPPRQPRLLDED